MPPTGSAEPQTRLQRFHVPCVRGWLLIRRKLSDTTLLCWARGAAGPCRPACLQHACYTFKLSSASQKSQRVTVRFSMLLSLFWLKKTQTRWYSLLQNCGLPLVLSDKIHLATSALRWQGLLVHFPSTVKVKSSDTVTHRAHALPLTGWYASGRPTIFCCQNSRTTAAARGMATSGRRK